MAWQFLNNFKKIILKAIMESFWTNITHFLVSLSKKNQNELCRSILIIPIKIPELLDENYKDIYMSRGIYVAVNQHFYENNEQM